MNSRTHQHGGYRYEFAEKRGVPDRLKCNICSLPSRDPHKSTCCGDIFCKSCLDHDKKAAATTNNACKTCGKKFETFPDRAVDNEIQELHVHCTNKVKGCMWKCKLKNINNHLGYNKNCQFEEVMCPNECGKMMERRHLTNHLKTACPRRKVNCKYCHDTGEHQFIESQHKEECPKLPLPCPNKCEVGSVLREDMEAHMKECPLEMIQCEYRNVGCNVKIARKDQQKHNKEKMEEHLMKTNAALTSTREDLANTKFRFSSQLSNVLQHINKLEVLLYMYLPTEFVTRPTNSAEEIVSSLRWSAKLKAMAYLADLVCQECPVVLKLPEYTKWKDNNVLYRSSSFYTHQNGYHMSLHVDLAGSDNGKGTHLSCFLYIKKGPHDKEVKWPMKAEFEIKLLNQINDSHHHSKTVRIDGKDPNEFQKSCEVTEVQFISNEDLHKTTATCQFLKDNCLFFQVKYTEAFTSYV